MRFSLKKWLNSTLTAVFATPLTREISRLNDNLESTMLFFGIPTLAEREAARNTPVQVMDYDEEQAAVAEFVDNHRPQPPNAPTDSTDEDFDA